MTNKELHTSHKAHTPVLVSEIISSVLSIKPQSFLDCTFGRGGHCRAFLDHFPEIKVLALDRDDEAIEYGEKNFSSDQVSFLKTNFHYFSENFETLNKTSLKKFDSILIDLGVSSPQLDQGERGFSFSFDGPLDMRMDREQQQTAKDIVNGFSKSELQDLFQEYGEIKRPFNVVDTLFKERKKKPIQTTRELVQLITKHSSWDRSGRHPATPYFLALRMKVNNELDGLKCLPSLLSLLKENGRFIVISFHSLEDRIVKHTFKSFVKEKQGVLWNKKAIRPSFNERQMNKRSRSAKLRVFIKGEEKC